MAQTRDAWQRIAVAAERLAEQNGVEAPETLRVVSGDVATRRALRLNALADLLELLAPEKPAAKRTRKKVEEPEE